MTKNFICRYCKYWRGCGICDLFKYNMEENDFCSKWEEVVIGKCKECYYYDEGGPIPDDPWCSKKGVTRPENSCDEWVRDK